MPQRAQRPCNAPGCTALVSNGRYCPAHQAAQPGRDEVRLSSNERGYGATWQRLRLIVLARSPLCADPFYEHTKRHEIVIATDVDHIVPRAAGGQDTESNLQALCHACHSHKTALQSSGWGRADRISAGSLL